ncbi:hypothetical protein Cni_G12634 [Canna indica]|uniref:Uncharacterized protein n=1 Tax=Canna indica TaxID=4628 RepID=A0AAQ3QAS3_9LILI|nr:hypothetical protein Cni_G12634 [Canna indica]
MGFCKGVRLSEPTAATTKGSRGTAAAGGPESLHASLSPAFFSLSAVSSHNEDKPLAPVKKAFAPPASTPCPPTVI